MLSWAALFIQLQCLHRVATVTCPCVCIAGAGGSSSSSVVPVGSATFKDEMAAMRRQLTEQEQFFKEEMAKMQERQERAMQDWQRGECFGF
jgi:hypothetical protein